MTPAVECGTAHQQTTRMHHWAISLVSVFLTGTLVPEAPSSVCSSTATTIACVHALAHTTRCYMNNRQIWASRSHLRWFSATQHWRVAKSERNELWRRRNLCSKAKSVCTAKAVGKTTIASF